MKTNNNQRNAVRPRKRKNIDPIEKAIEAVLSPGSFISYNADWQAVVADVRRRHFRKKGFMAGFEDIVAGTPSHVVPPFLERVKARWLRKFEDKKGKRPQLPLSILNH